jgi:hypothetical protein
MTERQVDLSQIRGDWHFHINYLANAIDATIRRSLTLWDAVQGEADAEHVGQLVKRQAEIWGQVTADRDSQGTIKTDGSLLDEFMEVCRSTKEPCDALEVAKGAGGSSSIYDTTLEQFTEACRQARGFCDDLEMMRDQRPAA